MSSFKNFSLISTVLNEEKQISFFLNSILVQTTPPKEIIIVDGGSTDRTAEIVDSFSKKHKVPITLLVKKSNRAVGRNSAIAHTTTGIIACSDVGCLLDKYWLQHITAPFSDKDVQVVAGYYKPIVNTVFQRALATYTCVMEDRLTDNFLPSSRSIAFRKDVWEKVKYPEQLDTCEDLVFAKKLQDVGFLTVFRQNAVVYWQQKNNIFEAGKQLFGYAVGDGQALYLRWQTPFLLLRILLGGALFLSLFYTNTSLLPFLFLLVCYIVWSIVKNYRYVKDPLAFLYLPLLQIASDIVVPLGMLVGLVKRLSR